MQGPRASGNRVQVPVLCRWVEGDGILSLPEGTGEPQGLGSVRSPGAGEKLRGGEGERGLWGHRRGRAAAGTGQWRLGEGRDAEGSGPATGGGPRVPW